MDNFIAIYKMLTALEKVIDYPCFDLTKISPERTGIE